MFLTICPISSPSGQAQEYESWTLLCMTEWTVPFIPLWRTTSLWAKATPSQTKQIEISTALQGCISKTVLCKSFGHRPETSEDAIFLVYLQSRTTFFQITDVFSFANQSLKARDGKQNAFARLIFSRNSWLWQATGSCVQCQALKRLLDATGRDHWLYTLPSLTPGSGVYCEQQWESDTSTLLPLLTSRGHSKKIHPCNLSR